MWMWIKKNPLAVVIIVVTLLVALGSAADSWRVRKLLKAQETTFRTQVDAQKSELKEFEAAWHRALASVTSERDALKKKLSQAQTTTFQTPKTDAETKARWRALGYAAEVTP